MIRARSVAQPEAKSEQDEECQILEDALCLVFLEHQLPGLAARTDREKVHHRAEKILGQDERVGPNGRVGLDAGGAFRGS